MPVYVQDWLPGQKETISASNINAVPANDPAKNIASPVGTPDLVLGNVNTTINLVGTWKIAKDSTHFDGGTLPNTATSENYTGTPGDYFKFTGDGRLFIKEKSIADTANYTLTGDNKVLLNYLFYNGLPVANYGSVLASFNQVGLSSKSVTLSSSIFTPQGVFYRKVDLIR